MPTLAVVDGVKIQVYPLEHPPPHFHVLFAEYRAQIDIRTLQVIHGQLPPAKLRSVIEWSSTRADALNRAWDDIVAGRRPERIA